MDYFTDLLATFLDVDRVNSIAVYGRVRQLSECKTKSQNNRRTISALSVKPTKSSSVDLLFKKSMVLIVA